MAQTLTKTFRFVAGPNQHRSNPFQEDVTVMGRRVAATPDSVATQEHHGGMSLNEDVNEVESQHYN